MGCWVAKLYRCLCFGRVLGTSISCCCVCTLRRQWSKSPGALRGQRWLAAIDHWLGQCGALSVRSVASHSRAGPGVCARHRMQLFSFCSGLAFFSLLSGCGVDCAPLTVPPANGGLGSCTSPRVNNTSCSLTCNPTYTPVGSQPICFWGVYPAYSFMCAGTESEVFTMGVSMIHLISPASSPCVLLSSVQLDGSAWWRSWHVLRSTPAPANMRIQVRSTAQHRTKRTKNYLKKRTFMAW